MSRLNIAILLAFSLAWTASSLAEPVEEPFVWPNGAKAAVSLTYDDAVPVHYRRVAPMLARNGLAGTFYLTMRYIESPGRWKALPKNGHELGNHTLFHSCRQDPEVQYTWLDDEYDLRKYSETRLRDELLIGNKYIDLLDGGVPKTFGNACNHVTFGEGKAERPMDLVLEEFFVAARGPVSNRIITPKNLNYYQLGHFKADGKTFEEMKAKVEDAVEEGGWVIFSIHGVGSDNHPAYMKDAEHKKLVQWLGQHKDVVWTAPVVDVATYLKRQH